MVVWQISGVEALGAWLTDGSGVEALGAWLLIGSGVEALGAWLSFGSGVEALGAWLTDGSGVEALGAWLSDRGLEASFSTLLPGIRAAGRTIDRIRGIAGTRMTDLTQGLLRGGEDACSGGGLESTWSL
ncbi:hnrpm [Lasius niger]|uniref:Hnrpm n=1 Tax=Lasius niger TaxID=67767 RepID=A0A0J7MU04_LASNI|nr:hnrpm [Lasius niger]